MHFVPLMRTKKNNRPNIYLHSTPVHVNSRGSVGDTGQQLKISRNKRENVCVCVCAKRETVDNWQPDLLITVLLPVFTATKASTNMMPVLLNVSICHLVQKFNSRSWR